ncbi:hypothetical protein [Methylobacterium thuringiense]|uniref:Transposase n=1 Tax=Methylobacterium thuringiense TaxID=1003091 RepID=A0ABQ4TTW3_9HYPH|nr:hypothetical protein [Methylobacterium thuringiense]GJE57398.1 hypothetical protein EKPJFOCH_3912 [Methylobacterium thuringiense]
MNDRVHELQDAIELLQSLRQKLSGKLDFRSRILLDMLLLEVAKDLARLSGDPQMKAPRQP